MNKTLLKQIALKATLTAVLVLPELANAQAFNYNAAGDVLAGFRKTAVPESFEMVVDLGNVTNFLNLTAGTTISITNYSPSQLGDAFADGNSNLQWSVFSSAPNGSLVTPLGTFPNATVWCTLASPSLNVQSPTPVREANLGPDQLLMQAVGSDALTVSYDVGVTNADYTPFVVLESVTNGIDLTARIEDSPSNPGLGDFGSSENALAFSVENMTPTNFVAAQRSDFYQMCPASAGRFTYTDPITGQTNGAAYFVGYFTFNPDGTMTFTRGPVTAPITISATNGEAPLTVVFTDTASGDITNWVWNFGDGTSVTNTTGGNVTYTYTLPGTNNATLTVYYFDGTTSTTPVASSIVVTPAMPVFSYNPAGDVLAGFRKSAPYPDAYEMVVDLGNVTNFLNLPAGTTISITNYSPSQLGDSFADGNSNLQWSVFASAPGALATSLGTFPNATVWCTLADPSLNTQSPAPVREANLGPVQLLVQTVGADAVAVSTGLGGPNADNTPYVVREPVATQGAYDLSASIGDYYNNALGDFGASQSPLAFSVENTTPTNFLASQRSDFYQMCPASAGRFTYTDPITGQTNGLAYFLGYFTLSPNGTMSFSRGFTVTATATDGFAPLTVVYSNTASSSLTNWVWNFGDGTSVTNTTGANVPHTYTAAGSYTVTLTVYGPGGSSTVTVANYIVASTAPDISATLDAFGNCVLSGANCPVGVQYHIVATSDLTQPIGTWTPVTTTNVFSSGGTFSVTLSPTNGASFFQLVSP